MVYINANGSWNNTILFFAVRVSPTPKGLIAFFFICIQATKLMCDPKLMGVV